MVIHCVRHPYYLKYHMWRFFERIQIIITFMVVRFPFHLLRDDMSAYVLQTVDNKRKQLLAFDVVPYCPAKFGEVLLFETR